MRLLDTRINFKPGDRQIWGSLAGAGASLVIAESAMAHQGVTLVITTDSNQAELIGQEIDFFLSAQKEIEVLKFPDWETLPYDNFSPHQDIISERLYTLYKLPQIKQGILVVPVTTLMHRLTPSSYLQANSLMLKQGDQLNLATQRKLLESAGYHCVDTVYEHGEFAIRGSLMDIYPMGSNTPYRIDLFDDEVDTIRTFNPENQRSTEQVKQIRLLPAKEFPLTDTAITHFKQQFRERFDVNFRECSLYRDINDGIAPAGIEYYLSLFFDDTALLFDYLPDNTLLFTQEDLEPMIDQFWGEIQARYENHRVNPERPILPPHQVFTPKDQLFSQFKRFSRITLCQAPQKKQAGQANFQLEPPPEFPVQTHSEHPLEKLEAFISTSSERILFCAETAGRREALLELLVKINIRPQEQQSWQAFALSKERFGIIVAPLDRGLHLTDASLLLLSENQLFGQRVQQRRRRSKAQADTDQVVRNLTELRLGAPVVHIDHGVGRYQGLTTLEIDNQPAEFLTLEYAGSAKLYVPVSDLHLIARYTGADESLAPLHRLGNEQWSKAKQKAAEKARDAAAELLDIYARREARTGFQFSAPDFDYDSFSASFPFEETPDQQAAIEAVIKDMTQPRPMDRLVCGDVGFGKTEVAMRAAFIAVQSGKQVVVLVPTTLLAQQHYESFRDRFADWPVQIEVMSRFKTAKQITELQGRLAEGKIDVVIGTHKLLQDNIQLKNLGLVIIDEEHRFGVRQKERLKSLRSEVDILTLTATPIPRTLNMAMAAIRDLSIIATPPAKRLSVRTFVRESDKSLIKEAVLRELLRGGQVYYLHNDVKTIEKTARELAELIPEARVGVGHGQLRERELEQVMSDFYHRRFNVLVCSTIIETGIDIPTANTIIIERADKFGLAQLHQLRGRVGRSHHQAYAYLLTPTKKAMTDDATKRLDAIAHAQDLGAGFTLATHDLEIRGAGELLGDEQSGQIQTVGFTLYMDMLERAVNSIRKGESPNLEQPLDKGPEINLRIPALITEDYVPDVHNRLILYKRIAGADDERTLKELQVEMIDRFGLLPEPTKNLIRITQLKQKSESLGIRKIDAGPQGGKIEFTNTPAVDPMTIVTMVQSQPQYYRLEGASLLRYQQPMTTSEERFKVTETLLEHLATAS